MEQLNFPNFTFNTRFNNNKKEIFDIIRKRFVSLTDEEWVRQNIIQFLILEKGFPKGLISVEAGLKVNRLKKRADIVIYNQTGKPIMIVECKASSVKINQDAFDQIARYNLKLNVNYLMVTNGLQHYFCYLNQAEEKWTFFREVLNFNELENK